MTGTTHELCADSAAMPCAAPHQACGHDSTLAPRRRRRSSATTSTLAGVAALAVVHSAAATCPPASSPYTHRWSALYGVGGSVGDVTLPASSTVLLDLPNVDAGVISVPAGTALLVDAAMPRIQIVADSVLVSGGRFTWGTEECPYTGVGSLTLRGTRDLGGYGRRVLGAGAGSVLDLHGSKGLRLPWTTLTTTAAAGSNTITVKGNAAAAGWAVGDEIVLPSTDLSPLQTEVVALTAVTPSADGATTQLRVNRTLTHSHFAGFTHGVAEFGEVGLLTRSITVSDVVGAGADGYGAHCMIMGGAAHTQVEGVRFHAYVATCMRTHAARAR
ncbi:MAG: hypothetical protein EOO41_04595, partial [Methanobacteriota archaeon]